MQDEQSMNEEQKAKEAFRRILLTIIKMRSELPMDRNGNVVADMAFIRSHEQPFLLFKN